MPGRGDWAGLRAEIQPPIKKRIPAGGGGIDDGVRRTQSREGQGILFFDVRVRVAVFGQDLQVQSAAVQQGHMGPQAGVEEAEQHPSPR